jgi:hypothetical protein
MEFAWRVIEKIAYALPIMLAVTGVVGFCIGFLSAIAPWLEEVRDRRIARRHSRRLVAAIARATRKGGLALHLQAHARQGHGRAEPARPHSS